MSLDEALTSINRAIELARAGDIRYIDALLHRIRGDILLRRDPANPAPAEQAYLAALAVAREQGARSFGLLAALKLAKLYQSTARPVEAHDVRPRRSKGSGRRRRWRKSRKGRRCSPRFLREERMEVRRGVAEAQAEIPDRLRSRDGDVPRLRLRGSEGRLRRVRELASGADDPAEQFDAHWGQWIPSVFRGELGLARKTAEIFVRETTSEAWMTEAVVARRMLGLTCLFQGDLIDARAHFEEAARIYDPERDRDAKFRFGVDPGATASVFLAHTIGCSARSDGRKN